MQHEQFCFFVYFLICHYRYSTYKTLVLVNAFRAFCKQTYLPSTDAFTGYKLTFHALFHASQSSPPQPQNSFENPFIFS